MNQENFTKIILGTVQFGLNYGINNLSGKPSLNEIQNILKASAGSAVNTLDTADAYGDAQEQLGQCDLRQFKVLSKFILNSEMDSVEKCLEVTLGRLKVEKIYAYSCHRFQDLVKCNPADIRSLKDSGKIQKFGVSLYSNEEFESALRCPWVDIIQIPFNILDNLSIRGELIRQAKENGKMIHIRSVFLQGLFFKNPDELVGKVANLRPYLSRIRDIAEKYKLSIEELCLSYVLYCTLIDGIILGVDTLAQLNRNLQCIARLNLNEKLIAEVNSIIVEDVGLLSPANWGI